MVTRTTGSMDHGSLNNSQLFITVESVTEGLGLVDNYNPPQTTHTHNGGQNERS
jgi:hypothetical protein